MGCQSFWIYINVEMLIQQKKSQAVDFYIDHFSNIEEKAKKES